MSLLAWIIIIGVGIYLVRAVIMLIIGITAISLDRRDKKRRIF
jgi:hypothetical protein